MSVNTHVDLHIWDTEKSQVAEYSLPISATDDYDEALAAFQNKLPDNLTAAPHTMENDHQIQFVFSEGLVTLEQYDPELNQFTGTERNQEIMTEATTFAEGFNSGDDKERFIKAVRVRLNAEKHSNVEMLTPDTVKSVVLEPEPELFL